MKNIPYCFSIFTIYCLETLTCCGPDIIRFELRTVSHIELKDKLSHVSPYNGDEECQKLCFYAKTVARLSYINPIHIPKWQEYVSHSSSTDPFHGAMYCATLPTVYLFKKSHLSSIQITFLHSLVENFKFESQIKEAHLITLEQVSEENNKEENQIATLSEEDRRNLCIAATTVPEDRRFHFLNNNVAEARRYKFNYPSNKEEIQVAIPCPTSPELYLQGGDTKTKLKLVVLLDPLVDDEFEVERKEAASVVHLPNNEYESTLPSDIQSVEKRKKLCTLAREYYISLPILFVQDLETPEVHFCSFQYPEEQPTRNVAVLCSAPPPIYIRIDNSSQNKIIKKQITFVQTPVNSYTYSVEILDYLYFKREDKITDLHRRKLNEHPFTMQRQEVRQDMCFEAQKFLFNDDKNPWKFRFAGKENIPYELQLLIIPNYVSSPQLYILEHLNGTREKDVVVIKCSEWPRMFVRLGQSNTEIKIMLLLSELADDIRSPQR